MLKECSECHGKGYVLGLNAIIDYENSLRFRRETCPKCNGKGFIIYEFLNGKFEEIKSK